MAEIVAHILEHGARENARRVRFAQLALLSERIQHGKLTSRSISDWFETLWPALADRPAADVLAKGSAFFWKIVYLAFNECVRTGSLTTRLADCMLRAGFDSFFDWIPDGKSIYVTRWDNSRLVLPVLGLVARLSGQGATIQRIRSGCLALEFDNERVAINLANPLTEFRLPVIGILGYPHAKLLLVSDPSLFEAQYIDKIAPATPKAQEFADMIGKSLDLIRRIQPEVGDRLIEIVRWYIPISTPGLQTHNSFSVRNLTGALFLSEAYNDIRLAEAMVHEFHHTELYLVQESEDLWDTGVGAELFYSPWRPDPRPIEGLFHALHVFSGVASFLSLAEKDPSLATIASSLRGRRFEVVRQLRFGLVQVPCDQLRPVGRDILQAIETEVEQQEREFGFLSSPVPEPIAQHVISWRAAHPDLASRIRMPAGVNVD